MDTLKAKIGPLPTWAWLLLITIAGLGYYLISSRKSAAATPATPASGTAQVPETVNQLSTTTIQAPVPPAAPGDVVPESQLDTEEAKLAAANKASAAQEGQLDSVQAQLAAAKRTNAEEESEEGRGEPPTHHGARHKTPPKRHVPPARPRITRKPGPMRGRPIPAKR